MSILVRVKWAPRSLLTEDAALRSDCRELDLGLSLGDDGCVLAIAGGRL